MLLLMGLPITFVGVAIAMFILGSALSAARLIWTNTLQEMIPKDMMGRIASMTQIGTFGLLPIGYALTGITADHFSAAFAFTAGGAITCLTISLGLLRRDVRGLD
jgi:DHA3 family tetracycline resistance protein-like MFS transporter